MQTDSSLVADIRTASRDLVRQFGLMNRAVAGTDLSLSAVHAIIEIGRADKLTAKQLCESLLLEKSTVSRLVKSLVERGEITETRSRNDLRSKFLQLTPRGRKTLRAIDRFAQAQVSGALQHLDRHARIGVLKGLQDYSVALKSATDERAGDRPGLPFTVEAGYAPTLSGRIIVMLLAHMHAHYGFARAFEARIGADLAEFMSRIESPRNRIWRALFDAEIVGSISIDGEDLGEGLAHLRWFVVDEAARGSGAGKALLEEALDFCDSSGYRETWLWTVKGLDAARRLYENHGFELAEEYRGDQWGSEVIEQKFVRPLAS
jgi:DNA-binding MarR family transcriptional regulator/GNAT superfamily N-acetyltransferase